MMRRGDLHRRQLAAHQLAPQRQHLVVEDLAVLDAAHQRLGRGDRHRYSLAFGGSARAVLQQLRAAAQQVDLAGQLRLRRAGAAVVCAQHELAVRLQVALEVALRLLQRRHLAAAFGCLLQFGQRPVRRQELLQHRVGHRLAPASRQGVTSSRVGASRVQCSSAPADARAGAEGRGKADRR
jgi:hypothetical protein